LSWIFCFYVKHKSIQCDDELDDLRWVNGSLETTLHGEYVGGGRDRGEKFSSSFLQHSV